MPACKPHTTQHLCNRSTLDWLDSTCLFCVLMHSPLSKHILLLPFIHNQHREGPFEGPQLESTVIVVLCKKERNFVGLTIDLEFSPCAHHLLTRVINQYSLPGLPPWSLHPDDKRSTTGEIRFVYYSPIVCETHCRLLLHPT